MEICSDVPGIGVRSGERQDPIWEDQMGRGRVERDRRENTERDS